MVDMETIMQKLRVGALEDITVGELEALIHYIENLEEIQTRYDNVMDTLHVEYEDMFPMEDNGY